MSNPYPENPYQLLEEARKSWDYFITDEIVYEGKFINSHRIEEATWVDGYRIGDVWFEVCANIGDKLGIALLIENCGDSWVLGSQANFRTDVAWRNDPMFVRVRQKFQVSEQLKFRPIPSVVWLKPFDFAMCSRQDKLKGLNSSPFVTHRSRVVIQGELNRPLLFRCELLTFHLSNMEHSEFPSNMIKRSPKVSDNITNNETPTLSSERRLNIHINQLCSGVPYELFVDGVLWVERALNTPFKGVDMYTCPLNLKSGIVEWLHML